jgi:hypothetical protein
MFKQQGPIFDTKEDYLAEPFSWCQHRSSLMEMTEEQDTAREGYRDLS